MVDSTAQELVEEINKKLAVQRLTPLALAAAAIALVALPLLSSPGWAYALWAVLVPVLLLLARYRDILAKSVVILYDIDSELLEVYGKLHDGIHQLGSSARAWHISQSAVIHDRKYHAGASTSIKRSSVSFSSRRLPSIKTNVEIPVLPAGRQLLAFTPERLLVFDGQRAGAVPYSQLSIQVSQTRFIEEQGVPADAQVVGQTWKYVNKKGGPDRRFKDNRQLPIVIYEETHLTSPSGLNELFNFSKVGASSPFVDAIRAMASTLQAIPVNPGPKAA
jgi:hypothetical protein